MTQYIPTQNIAVIGATGSVGTSVLDICARFPQEFNVVALAANSNEKKLAELGHKFKAKTLCLSNPATAFSNNDFECISGVAALSEIAQNPEIDHVVFASSGTEAIPALMAAIKAGKKISLANKESIVVAGPWVMTLVQFENQIRPVDSEHSAVWQCMEGCRKNEIEKLWLTASGGPFRNFTKEQMEQVTPEMALKHPTWNMGAKITIDSATLMNKGIECIEAAQLFEMPQEKVCALVHPTSSVHGLVQFKDGSTKLLLSAPDMRLPAAAALAWSNRLPLIESGMQPLNPAGLNLEFGEIDGDLFPCFEFAREAGKKGGAYPALLVGADQVAVENFLCGKIKFTEIAKVVEAVLESYGKGAPRTVEDAIALVGEGERLALEICNRRCGKC